MQTEKNKITLDCKVDSYRSGWTVVEFLSHRFRYHPAERWTHRVDDGRVMVNGSRVGADHTVNHNDVVSYTIIHNEPEVDFGYDIIYEDDDMMAVSKPGNLPVHACGVYIRNTLITHLRNRYGDHISLGHRLDRETSGCLVLAKKRSALRALHEKFREGVVEKNYLALAVGDWQLGEQLIDKPLLVTHRKGGERHVIVSNEGKPAQTRVRLSRTFGAYSLVQCSPITGR